MARPKKNPPSSASSVPAASDAVDVAARMKLPRLLKTRDVMKFYSVGRSKVDRLVADGQLPARRFGRQRLFRLEDVEAFFSALPSANPSTSPPQ